MGSKAEVEREVALIAKGRRLALRKGMLEGNKGGGGGRGHR